MEFFVTADGRTIPGGSVFYAFYGIEGVEQFRVIQKKINVFEVHIVPGTGYSPASEARIRQGIEKRMRSSLEVDFQYFAGFPVSPTGKFRCIVSEVATSPYPQS